MQAFLMVNDVLSCRHSLMVMMMMMMEQAS